MRRSRSPSIRRRSSTRPSTGSSPASTHKWNSSASARRSTAARRSSSFETGSSGASWRATATAPSRSEFPDRRRQTSASAAAAPIRTRQSGRRGSATTSSSQNSEPWRRSSPRHRGRGPLPGEALEGDIRGGGLRGVPAGALGRGGVHPPHTPPPPRPG